MPKPEPVAHLYRYHCKPCNQGHSTTEDDDAACECQWCGESLEAYAVVPLFEDEPAAINCLRAIDRAWSGDSQTLADAVNAGRELVDAWDEQQAEESAEATS